MVPRWSDWWRQAERDLAHARHALTAGYYEWAGFAAQRAADKGVKAGHEAYGRDGNTR
jgi:HEPN domain-containing protein